MRLQVEVWRENEDELRRIAVIDGRRPVRDKATLVLNLFLKESRRKHEDEKQLVEEVA